MARGRLADRVAAHAVSGRGRNPGRHVSDGVGGLLPEEAPVHRVTVDGFSMDQYLVTNTEFTRFVEATGYVTLGERAPRVRHRRQTAVSAQMIPVTRDHKFG